LSSDYPLGFERYLTRFQTRHVPAYRFDLVVLGGGVAGGVAALAAARRGLEVAVLTKGGLRDGNTRWARGGLAAVLSPEDSFDSHIADTLKCGRGLCDPEVVERIVTGGPKAVELLISLGAEFDRAPGGELLLSREGGHSFKRIVHARGDSTGLEIQRALTDALRAEPRITLFPDTFAIDLLEWKQPSPIGAPAARANQLGIFRMAFMVADAQAAHAELLRHGVAAEPPVFLEMGPEIPVDGVWAVFFRDPDGTCLEFIQSPV